MNDPPQHDLIPQSCGLCFNDITGSKAYRAGDSAICEDCARDAIVPHFMNALRWEHAYPAEWAANDPLSVLDYEDVLPAEFDQHYHMKGYECSVPSSKRVHCLHKVMAETAGREFAAEYPFHRPFWRDSRGGLALCDPRLLAAAEDSQVSITSCGFFLGPQDELELPPSNANCCQEDGVILEDDLGGLLRGRDFQICPNDDCRRRVTLWDGCNHLFCRCGTDLCFICGKEVAHDDPEHWAPGGCPRWNQPGADNAGYDGDDVDGQVAGPAEGFADQDNLATIDETTEEEEDGLPSVENGTWLGDEQMWRRWPHDTPGELIAVLRALIEEFVAAKHFNLTARGRSGPPMVAAMVYHTLLSLQDLRFEAVRMEATEDGFEALDYDYIHAAIQQARTKAHEVEDVIQAIANFDRSPEWLDDFETLAGAVQLMRATYIEVEAGLKAIRVVLDDAATVEVGDAGTIDEGPAAAEHARNIEYDDTHDLGRPEHWRDRWELNENEAARLPGGVLDILDAIRDGYSAGWVLDDSGDRMDVPEHLAMAIHELLCVLHAPSTIREFAGGDLDRRREVRDKIDRRIREAWEMMDMISEESGEMPLVDELLTRGLLAVNTAYGHRFFR
ncbi:hypothetical protein LTR53_008108 [Teratosphaeriaceae sp. CCFEE 6253]|nr:hypothetical protein LTR53_008108 [Teratosphaeriaceae sp. CCFEE 6253]